MNAHAHTDARDREIARLTERNEALREEIRQYRAILKPVIALPAAWRLTGKQADILLAMRAVSPDVLTRERGFVAIYGLSNDIVPGDRIIDVWISKVRTRLRAAGSGIVFESFYERGWRLDPENARRFDAAVAEASAHVD